MINQPFANAEQEGEPRNGVLTAAEDFVRKASVPLNLLTLPIHNGVSILYAKGSAADRFIQDQVGPSSLLVRLLETVEVARLNSIVDGLKTLQAERQSATSTRSRLERRLHRLIEYIFNRVP